MKNFFFYFLMITLYQNCNKNKKEITSLDADSRIMIKYQDSLIKKPLDSLYIKGIDTIFYNNEFPIKGYFKIYEPNEKIYSEGEINKDKKIGNWYTFQKDFKTQKWELIKESHYDQHGHLEGFVSLYNPHTEKPIAIHRYIDDEEKGEQLLFYPSGRIYMKYERDGQSNYINTFTIFNKQGKILFSTDLGEEGSGYIKYYNQNNYLEWEGRFINKMKQGWHKMYIAGSIQGKEKLIEKAFYKNDNLLFQTRIPESIENTITTNTKGKKIDSITYTSINNQKKVKYYCNGKIIKEEFEK